MCGAAHVPGAELCAHVLLNLFTCVSVSTLHRGQGVQHLFNPFLASGCRAHRSLWCSMGPRPSPGPGGCLHPCVLERLLRSGSWGHHLVGRMRLVLLSPRFAEGFLWQAVEMLCRREAHTPADGKDN